MVINYWCIGCVKKNEEGSYSGEGRRLIWWCDRGAQAVQAIVVVKTIWIDITIIIDIVLAAENIIISYKNDLLQQHLFIVNSRQHLPRHLPILHKDIRGTLIIILIIIVYLLHLILSTRNTSLYSIHCTHTRHIPYDTRRQQRMHKIPIQQERKKKLLPYQSPTIHPYPQFLLFAPTWCFSSFSIMNITYCKHLPVYNLIWWSWSDVIQGSFKDIGIMSNYGCNLYV